MGWNHQPVIFFCIIVLIIQQTICKSVEEVGPPRKHLYGGALLSNYRHHEEQMTRGNFGFRLSRLGNNKKWNIIDRTLSIRSTDGFFLWTTDMIFEVWMIFFGDVFFSSLKVYVFDWKKSIDLISRSAKKNVLNRIAWCFFSYEKTGSLAPSTYRGSLVRLPRVSSKWSPDGHRTWIVTHQLLHHRVESPGKTNMVHLKMGAPWKFGDSELGKHHFSGAMLVFGGGNTFFLVSWNTLYFLIFSNVTWLNVLVSKQTFVYHIANIIYIYDTYLKKTFLHSPYHEKSPLIHLGHHFWFKKTAVVF